jgi:hypothetical protein
VRAGWALAALVVIAACSLGEDEARRAAERDDAAELEALLAQDPAAAALREMDEAVDDELSVHAAKIIAERALPAARDATRAAEALEARSEAGRALGRALVSAYGARVAALERTERALARGVADDLVLADAFRAQREAAAQLIEVHRGVAALREGPTVAEDR